MRAVAVTVTTLVLLAVLLGAGGTAYVAYFKTPAIADATPAPPARPALAERAVMFVIDGFAAAPPLDATIMPTFAKLVREGASGTAQTSSMSLTAPCVFSLGTGRPGTLMLGILDFHAPPARVESLPSLVVAAGKRVLLSGDPSWTRQFGWLAKDGDTHEHPEPGVTLDPRVRVADRESVAFLVRKFRDPAYGLLVVHVSSADAVGHVVTPTGAEYREALTFLDGLIADVVAAVDEHTVVLVTGDHGMGPRGTHGGRDDAATLTPYVLWGAGVRPGATADLPQTAIPTTLAALLGVPLPAAGEQPPATTLLALDETRAAALSDEFLARKLAAARTLAPDVTLEAAPARANEGLNEVLFASRDRKIGPRALTFALFVIAAVAAIALARRALDAGHPQPPGFFLTATALAVPVLFATAAAVLIEWRSALPLQPKTLAACAAALLGAVVVAGAVVVHRSTRAQRLLQRSELAWYFGATVVLVTPLVLSGWAAPDTYFRTLALVLIAAGLVLTGRLQTGTSTVSGWVSVSLLSAGVYGSDATSVLANELTYVVPMAVAVAGLVAVNVAGLPRWHRAVAFAVLAAAIATTVSWWTHQRVADAFLVLGVFVVGMGTAFAVRRDPRAAASLMIVVATAFAVTMASDGRETLVFLIAGVAALCVTRQQLPVDTPRALYFVALTALVLRISLYFALGDQYNLSSIRTAAGFRLVESGLALPWVIAMLLLKYTIPWVLILAAMLPSVAAGGRLTAECVVQLLVLGYVGRFLALAAVTDPFRVLPHGMEGLVGLFAISWAELLTLGAAAIPFLLVGSPALATRPATAPA